MLYRKFVFVTLHFILILPAISQHHCPQETTEKREFLKLVREVSWSLQEKHMGDAMLPICSQLTRTPAFQEEPQEFQKVANKDLLVFSAFVERRPEADGPAIRVIGSGLQEKFNRVGSHYCQLWYHDLKHPISVGPALYQVIYRSLFHADMWVAHFVICKLPIGYSDLPYAISITATRCEAATNELMVLNRETPDPTDTHALCIGPMWNHYNGWELLIEQVELHKLLGNSEVVLYLSDISQVTAKVVQSYLEDETENIIVVRFRFPSEDELKNSYRCQRAALNDCLYRMGHRHKYVAITDMDEVLVPRKENTWPALIHRLNSKAPNIGAFLFQHAYFRRNTSSEAPTLVTQSSFWRTHEVAPAGKVRSKAIYEAAKAISIDFHAPYSLIDSATEFIVDPADGMLHHYRAEPMEYFIKRQNELIYIEDRHMDIYREKLLNAVNQRHKYLGSILNNTSKRRVS